MVDNLDWEYAGKRLNTYLELYSDLPMGQIALDMVLKPIKARYDSGERTQELFDDIMRVE